MPLHFQDAIHGIGGLESAGVRSVRAINRRQALADGFVQERREFFYSPGAVMLHQRTQVLAQQRVPGVPGVGQVSVMQMVGQTG